MSNLLLHTQKSIVESLYLSRHGRDTVTSLRNLSFPEAESKMICKFLKEK